MRMHLDIRNSLLSLVIVSALATGFALPAVAQFNPVTAQHQAPNDSLPTVRLTCGEKQGVTNRTVRAHFRLGIRAPLAGLTANEVAQAEKEAKQGCVDNLNAVLRVKTYCDPTSCFKGDKCWPASYAERWKWLLNKNKSVMVESNENGKDFVTVTCTSDKPKYVCSTCGVEPSQAVLRVVPKKLVNDFDFWASQADIKANRNVVPPVAAADPSVSAQNPPRKQVPELHVRRKGEREKAYDDLELWCSNDQDKPGSAELKKVEHGARGFHPSDDQPWITRAKKKPLKTKLQSSVWYAPSTSSDPKVAAAAAAILVKKDDEKGGPGSKGHKKWRKRVTDEYRSRLKRTGEGIAECTRKFEDGLKGWYDCTDDNFCPESQDCTQVVDIPKGAVTVRQTTDLLLRGAAGIPSLALGCKLRLTTSKGQVELKCECLNCAEGEGYNYCMEGLDCLESGEEWDACSSGMSDAEYDGFVQVSDCASVNCNHHEDEESFFACVSEQCGEMVDQCEAPIPFEPMVSEEVRGSETRSSESLANRAPESLGFPRRGSLRRGGGARGAALAAARAAAAGPAGPVGLTGPAGPTGP